jgi:CBS domain containing-hemolysin-like protein
MTDVTTMLLGLTELSPSRGTSTILGALVLVALVGLSAFFSSSEIAMFSLARHRVDALAEDGVPGAETMDSLLADPHRLLVTILVGNNLVNIAMSSIATGLLAMYLSQGQSVLAATFGITAVVLLFGESVPKSYAIENTEEWALTVAMPLKLSEYGLYPLVVTFDRLTRLVNRIGGADTAIDTSYVTRDEIREMIQTGASEGVIEADEREMLQRIFRFDDTIAKEVMTPRLDVTAVERNTSPEAAIATCVEAGHTRLPVYDGDLDNVVGIVELSVLVGDRDSVQDGAAGETAQTGRNAETVSPYVSETLQVPETKHVDDLLTEMRAERRQMVVVIDEFGTTEGIVTTEDIVEEIVGEILEEQETAPITHLDDRTVRIDGAVNVEAVNETLDVTFPEGKEYETIAGFLFNRAGRLVEHGETFTYEGAELVVDGVENTRITSVTIQEPSLDSLSEGDTAATS